MYDYLEERPLGGPPAKRRQANVRPRLATGVTNSLAIAYSPSGYVWWRTRELEGTAPADEAIGVWPINHSRVYRHGGDPGNNRCPWPSLPTDWPQNVHVLARQFRLHHYFRVWNAAQCRELLGRGGDVKFAFGATEEWHDPTGGILDIPPESPVLGSHAVPIVGYDPKSGRFVFQNSWGSGWGNNGFGEISTATFDRFLIESWCLVGIGVEPPVAATSGLVCLLWKSGLGGQEVHGREIVDAATGERIAWAFLVRRGRRLEMEEFFVWPMHRHKGYARKLTELVQELARDSKLQLVAWIPFADVAPENRRALRALMDLLGLELWPSTHKSAAFLAAPGKFAGQLTEPEIPERPASVHARLDPAAGTRAYPVWFGTNRKPRDPKDPGKGFSGARDDRVHFGRCLVAIPRSHRFGTLGSSWWKRWVRLDDDRLEIIEHADQSEERFWEELAESMQRCDQDERQGLIFLHGYNVEFEEAAIRAAQIGFDLKVPGLTAFFSWASCGTLAGYQADEATIEASEHFISGFLADFVARSGAQRVHIVAHSMGNRGLVRALGRLAEGMAGSHVPFGQIILAAPDIDQDLFIRLAAVYPRVAQRTTLYASRTDRAVAISNWLHSYPRAGLTPPVTIVAGVDTVEVPSFNILDLGHGYYAEADGLLHDMFDLIRRNAAPAGRQRLAEARTEDGKLYWVMC